MINTKKKFILITSSKWFDIFHSILFNFISIPIFLSKWGLESLALWILFQSIKSYIFIINISYKDFVYSENLKLGIANKKKIVENIYASVIISILISLLIICFFYIELKYEILINYFEINLLGYKDLLFCLFFYTITSAFTNALFPFFSEALNIFGFQHFFSWFKTLIKFIIHLSIIISILIFGTNFKETVINYLIIECILFSIFYFFLFKIYIKEKFIFKKINFKNNLIHFYSSIWNLASNLLDTLSQQGLRIILNILSGPNVLVVFYSIRVFSNLITQFINSFKEPLLPNLMSYINNRDLFNIQRSIDIFYILLNLFIFPSIILISLFIDDFFMYWTNNKIKFDFYTYSILVTSALINACSIPHRLIIDGNNLVKSKFLSVFYSSLILIFFIFFMHNKLLIMTFSIGILIFENVSIIYNFNVINSFLRKKKLILNNNYFFYTLILSYLNLAFLILIIIFPNYKILIFIIYLMKILIFYSKLNILIKSEIKSLIRLKV